MKIAIVGAGLAGLGLAYFLLQEEGHEVTLFDSRGIGGGASGVCSGLLHPYPGFAAKRSSYASEALMITKGLIKVAEAYTPEIVARQNGILRQAQSPEQKEMLLSHCAEFGDIEQMEEEAFLIHSGITVSLSGYLNGLWNYCKAKGAHLLIEKIEALAALSHFDEVVVAAGYGVKRFFPDEKLQFLKGQSLLLEGTPPFEKSWIGRGYISHLGTPSSFEVGSTYERYFTHEAPSEAVAKQLLEANLSAYGKGAKVVGCKAGIRVASPSSYLPVIQKMDGRVHLFTGLGSRGLLYHGYYGRLLANRILSKNRQLA